MIDHVVRALEIHKSCGVSFRRAMWLARVAIENPMAWQRFCEIARSGARVGTGALIDRWV